MTSATTQALPTLNAVKKGWSAAARLKSALVRKAKKKPTPLKKVSPNSPEYKKLKEGDKEKVLNNALKQFDKQGSAYRSVKTKGYKNLLDVRVEANKSIGRFEGMARAYRKRAEGLKGKKRRIYLHMALNCLQQASQLSSDVMKRKRPVTTNMIKTLLIINAFQESTNNAKKGWSDVARKKAAAKRRFKVKIKDPVEKGVSKKMQEFMNMSPEEAKKAEAAYFKAHGKKHGYKPFLTDNAKKGSSKGTGWSAKARIAAALARKKKTGTKSGESKVVKKKVAAPKQQIKTKLPSGVKVKHNSKGKAHYEYQGTTYTTLGMLKEGIKRKSQPVEPDNRSLYERRMDQFNS